MQTATYNIYQRNRISLWRALPTQLTISGIDDISGTWKFYIDNNWVDGALITGAVSTDENDLIISINNLENAYLANAINGKPEIQCNATLTNENDQCYVFQILIKNRTTLDAPPEPAPQTKVFVKTVNGESGVVVLDASKVGALSNAGKEIIELENTTITPAYNVIYELELNADATLTITGLEAGKAVDFQLNIIQGATPFNVTWPNGIKWGDNEGKFSANNEAPDINTANTVFGFTGRIRGNRILMNLALIQEM